MKIIVLFLAAAATVICPLCAEPWAKLILLDGRTFDGAETRVVDNWRIGVRHEDGTATVLLALLSNADIARVAPTAVRDGRFWAERAAILHRLWELSGKKVPLREALAEVWPHGESIAQYLAACEESRAKGAETAATAKRAAREAKLRDWEMLSDPYAFREWTYRIARERYLQR